MTAGSKLAWPWLCPSSSHITVMTVSIVLRAVALFSAKSWTVDWCLPLSTASCLEACDDVEHKGSARA